MNNTTSDLTFAENTMHSRPQAEALLDKHCLEDPYCVEGNITEKEFEQRSRDETQHSKYLRSFEVKKLGQV